MFPLTRSTTKQKTTKQTKKQTKKQIEMQLFANGNGSEIMSEY